MCFNQNCVIGLIIGEGCVGESMFSLIGKLNKRFFSLLCPKYVRYIIELRVTDGFDGKEISTSRFAMPHQTTKYNMKFIYPFL